MGLVSIVTLVISTILNLVLFHALPLAACAVFFLYMRKKTAENEDDTVGRVFMYIAGILAAILALRLVVAVALLVWGLVASLAVGGAAMGSMAGALDTSWAH